MLDLAAWFESISATSPLAFAVVAMAGLAMGVAPSSLPLFSVIAGYVAGRSAHERTTTGPGEPALGRRRGLWLSSGFVLGMATVDAAIGAVFGFVGYAVVRVLAGYLALTNLLVAVVLFVLGLALLRKIRVALPVVDPALRRTDSFPAAYTLGVPFGLAACPACTPMLLPILTAAAATGTPGWGALLLFVFGLARGLPLIIVGAATGTIPYLGRLAPWIPRIERAGGVLLLVSAIYFLYQGAIAGGLISP